MLILGSQGQDDLCEFEASHPGQHSKLTLSPEKERQVKEANTGPPHLLSGMGWKQTILHPLREEMQLTNDPCSLHLTTRAIGRSTQKSVLIQVECQMGLSLRRRLSGQHASDTITPKKGEKLGPAQETNIKPTVPWSSQFIIYRTETTTLLLMSC